MADIAKLTVALYANSAQFVSELEKSKKKSKDWSSYVSNSFATAAKATAGAATATVAALGLIYKQQSSLIDQTAKFADRIGITTEALTQYRYASELTGVGQQKFDTAMQRMTRRTSEAAQGTGAAAGALKELNLNAAELNRLTPDQQLKRIADAMQNVENHSDRLRLSVKLFDTEGAAMVNMLSNGSQGLNDMAAEADRLGVTLSRIDAAKIEMANDSMARLAAMSDSWKRSLAVEMAPLFAAVADEISKATQSAGGFGVVTTEALGTVIKGVGFLGDVWRGWDLIIKASEVGVRGYKLAFMETYQTIIDGAVIAGETITKSITFPLQQTLNMAGRFSDVAADAARSLSELTTFNPPQLFNVTDAKLEYNQALWELRTLASEPLPSVGIETWYNNARQRINDAAELYAQNIHRNSNDTVSMDFTANFSNSATELYSAETAKIQQEYTRRLAIIAAGENAKTQQEAFAYEDRQAQIAARFQTAYESLEGNLTAQKELEEDYFSAREVLWLDHQSRLTEIEKQAAKDRAEHQQRVGLDLLSFTQQQMSLTTNMLRNSSQESGKLYKTLFFAQKAAAIPSMIIATNEAYTKALAAFPLAPYYAESVRAMGYASVGIAAGTALAGMSHDGSSGFANGRIPKEGTWLLDQGQRVQTRPEADRMDALHSAVIKLANSVSGQNKAQSSGGDTFSFNLHAVDARGIEEVIMNNKATIYNAVRAVKNDMGERF